MVIVKSPVDHFTGVSMALTMLPHKVLLFQRSREELDPPVQSKHHRFVLIVPLRGEGGIILDGSLHAVSPGQALLIFPYQTHHYAQLKDRALQWLFVMFEYDIEAELASLREQVLQLSEKALQQLHVLVSAYQRDTEDPFRAGEIVMSLAAFLMESLITCHASQPDLGIEQNDYRAALIGRVCHYVYENAASPLSPESVAQQFDISESHLRAIFREMVGISLGRFIRQARISMVCHYLRSTDLQITDIAVQCGYDSISSLSRAFRHMMQSTPQDFRRKYSLLK